MLVLLYVRPSTEQPRAKSLLAWFGACLNGWNSKFLGCQGYWPGFSFYSPMRVRMCIEGKNICRSWKCIQRHSRRFALRWLAGKGRPVFPASCHVHVCDIVSNFLCFRLPFIAATWTKILWMAHKLPLAKLDQLKSLRRKTLKTPLRDPMEKLMVTKKKATTYSLFSKSSDMCTSTTHCVEGTYHV